MLAGSSASIPGDFAVAVDLCVRVAFSRSYEAVLGNKHEASQESSLSQKLEHFEYNWIVFSQLFGP